MGLLSGEPEPVEDSASTFGSKWDRVTYLLAVYRVSLTLLGIAVVVAYSVFDARIPAPPGWVVEFIIPAGLLAVPVFFVWRNVARKVISIIGVEVIEYNGPLKDDRAFLIPPRTWKRRETGEVDAYRPPGGDVYKVNNLEWMEDTGTLRVEGVWPSIADPNDVYKSQVRFDRVFMDLIKELMKSEAFSAAVAEKGVAIYDESTKEQIALIENGTLPDGVGAVEKIEELDNELSGALDLDAIGEPTRDDTAGGDRIDETDPVEPGPGGANPGEGPR